MKLSCVGGVVVPEDCSNVPVSPGSSGDVILESLAQRIRRQDRLIEQLQADLDQARKASVDVMLGQLRLREAVLLYVGRDADNLVQQLSEAFGSEIARAVLNSVFVLDNAPVTGEVREAMRKATYHGMNRW